MSRLGPSRFFPSPELASPEGLLAVGGSLSPERLLDAYRHGIFPWPIEGFDPVLWWSPDPRAVFEFDRFHISRRLARTCRNGGFEITFDRDFPAVIVGCAESPGRKNNTWITPAMIEAYTRLHELGHAHSVEVWRQGRLVGGVYGVAVGGLFAAESMFSLQRDASKVALVHLRDHLVARGFAIWDIQVITPHTASLGAVEIPRREYLRRLAAAIELPATFGP